MVIIGKYGNKMIWKCDKGFHHTGWIHNSGCLFCEHEKGETYFDFLDVSKLKEITDEKIINEINK